MRTSRHSLAALLLPSSVAFGVPACGDAETESAGDAQTAQIGARCRTSGDCNGSAKYCAPNASGEHVCQEKLDTGYGACGRLGNALGVGRACGSCMGTANVCVDAPELDTAFCSLACSSDDECGPDAFCGKTSSSKGNVCIPFNCACVAETETGTLLAQALATGERTMCDLGQRFGSLSSLYADSIAHDPVRPTFYQRLYHAPMAIPHAGRQLADAARASRSRGYVSEIVRMAARLWDEEPSGSTSLPPAPSFEDAVAALSGAPRDAIAADAKDLPQALREALVPVLVAVRTAIDLRQGAIPEGADLRRWFRAPMGMFVQMREVIPAAEKIDLTRTADRDFLLRGFRYDQLARAAIVIAEAVETSGLKTGSFPGNYAFDHETPFGRIVIRGTGDDVYFESDPKLSGELLLVVDTGGNDRYEIPVGGTQSPSNPVSVAIDLGGNDTYTYVKTVQGVNERPDPDAAGRRPTVPRHSLSEVRRQGAGTLGVGMLFDFGHGDDLYESLRFSQGSGVLGVGVLYDEAGNDRYIAETAAQGGAQLGLGVLIDGGGNDTYRGFSVTQGAAHVKAVGLLVDHGGNDTYWTSPGNSYIAEAGRIKGHDYFYEYGINQGAAWGRRGDYPQDFIRNDGHMSGGIGALLDLGGSDKYTCGAFCQGTGYWFGTGILWDDGVGNDESYARIFAGGSGVHFGLGVYHDGGGDDRHHVDAQPEGLTFGSGDDLSLGWFEDLGGNDRYVGGRHSFGSGTEKGVGVFIDMSGDDRYESAQGDGFGSVLDPADWQKTSHPRYGLASMAVFVDGAGNDTYSRAKYFAPDPIGNGRAWKHPWIKDKLTPGTPVPSPVTYPVSNVFGLGLDR